MDFQETRFRSFDFLGGQSAPRAVDGVGIKLLYRCGLCQQIWFQDGKRIALDVGESHAQALALELHADLARLPNSTCRVCLYRAGGGAIEVDEYGKGAGFGFSWECPPPSLVHALLTVYSCAWSAQLTDKAALLPDIVTRPERMRAVLAWFVELLPPRRYRLLEPEILLALNATNRPGFGQPGTEYWHWQGCQFAAPCPPLGGKASLLLTIAMPVTQPFSVPTVFPIWQSLAFLALLGGIVGEKRKAH